MATDIRISLPDRPGALAQAAQALGEAGVNIEGICGQIVDGKGAIHLLVEDREGAMQALSEAGIQVQSTEEMLVLGVEDRPGVLGQVAADLAEAGINIHTAYLATATRLVLGVSDLQRAKQVAGRTG